MRYQLLVIGSDPAGREAAVAAAARDVRVAVVERDGRAGMDRVTESIDRYRGIARFIGPHLIDVAEQERGWLLESDKTVLACGTRALRPAFIPFDGRRVLDVDEIHRLEAIPRSLLVVGASQAGLREAIAFATLGARVVVLEARPALLERGGGVIESDLLQRVRTLGIEIHPGREVIGMDRPLQGPVRVHLTNGESVTAETVLYAVGRVGNTEGMNLPAAGIEPDERGRVWCNADQQTWTPHIYAVGDLVGFPPLERSAAAQGRHVVQHAFGILGDLRRGPGRPPAGRRTGRSAAPAVN